jgi:hypothetical protein
MTITRRQVSMRGYLCMRRVICVGVLPAYAVGLIMAILLCGLSYKSVETWDFKKSFSSKGNMQVII